MLFVSLFFFKQRTAYEMRISDWSSDVCSSDLGGRLAGHLGAHHRPERMAGAHRQDPGSRGLSAAVRLPALARCLAPQVPDTEEIGRASCRERVCQYV